MKNVHIAAIAVLAVFVCAPVSAQDAATSPAAPQATIPAPAPQATAPQAAPTPAIPAPAPQATAPGMTDPKALEAANELVRMVDSDAIYKSLFSIMTKSMLPIIMRDNPNKAAEIQKIVIDSMSAAFHAHGAELASNKAVVYARVFTYDELEQIIAFYKTPTGAKMLKSVPEVMEQSAQLNAGITMQIVRETQSSVVATLKKNGLKVPKEMGI